MDIIEINTASTKDLLRQYAGLRRIDVLVPLPARISTYLRLASIGYKVGAVLGALWVIVTIMSIHAVPMNMLVQLVPGVLLAVVWCGAFTLALLGDARKEAHEKINAQAVANLSSDLIEELDNRMGMLVLSAEFASTPEDRLTAQQEHEAILRSVLSC